MISLRLLVTKKGGPTLVFVDCSYQFGDFGNLIAAETIFQTSSQWLSENIVALCHFVFQR